MGTDSAAKAWRRSEQRRLRNRAHRSTAKTLVGKAEMTIAAADPEESLQAVRMAISALDRAAQKGALHPGNAARRKAGLMKRYNVLLATAAVAKEEAPPPKRRRKKAEAPAEEPTKKRGRAKRKQE